MVHTTGRECNILDSAPPRADFRGNGIHTPQIVQRELTSPCGSESSFFADVQSPKDSAKNDRPARAGPVHSKRGIAPEPSAGTAGSAL